MADEGTVQCPNEKCRNDSAYWYQLQIRSADEPMTAFYKVRVVHICRRLMLTDHSVQSAAKNGASKLIRTKLHTGAFGLENCIIIPPTWTLKLYYSNLHTAFISRSLWPVSKPNLLESVHYFGLCKATLLILHVTMLFATLALTPEIA
jgi:hypothetical protein